MIWRQRETAYDPPQLLWCRHVQPHLQSGSTKQAYSYSLPQVGEARYNPFQYPTPFIAKCNVHSATFRRTAAHAPHTITSDTRSNNNEQQNKGTQAREVRVYNHMSSMQIQLNSTIICKNNITTRDCII